jgi:hypothetical protein
MELAHLIIPMKDILISPVGSDNQVGEDDIMAQDTTTYESGGAEKAKQGLQYSLDLNFGELEFDWDKRIVSVRTLGKDLHAPPLIAAKYSFDQLSGVSPFPEGEVGLQEMIARNRSDGVNSWTRNFSPGFSSIELRQHQWTCIDYRGTVDPVRIATSYTSLTFTAVGVPLIVILWLLGIFRHKFCHLIAGVINDNNSIHISKKLTTERIM